MARLLASISLASIFGLLLAIPSSTVAAPPQSDQQLVDKVKSAIDSGVKYFESTQTPAGNWEGVLLQSAMGMDGGTTSLVTLALLNCGRKPEEKSVARALD
jgi:hypothetical protein